MRGQQFSSQQPAVDDEANQVQSQNDSIIRRQPQPQFVPSVPIPHSHQQIQQQRTAEDDNHLWSQSQPNTIFVGQQFRRGPISSSYSQQNIIDNPSVENYDELQRAHSSTSSGIHRSQPLCIQSEQLQQVFTCNLLFIRLNMIDGLSIVVRHQPSKRARKLDVFDF